MRFLYLAGLLVVSRILRDLQIVSRVLRGLRSLPAVPGQVPETEIIAKHISQVARDAASGGYRERRPGYRAPA